MAPIDDAKQGLSGIGRVDLRGIEPSSRGWEEARAAVAASMEALGAVLVVQDALSPDLRRALFGRAMPELFALPLDVKRSLVSGHINGYVGPRPSAPSYESVRAWETTNGGAVRNVGDVLWPHGGNPAFWYEVFTTSCSFSFLICLLTHASCCPAFGLLLCSGTVSAFATNMLGLQRKVGTMVLESLGVGQGSLGSHLGSLSYSVRLSHYGVSEAGGGMLMKSHRDPTVLSVVVQHDVEGLEVQAQDGSWLAVAPQPDTVAVLAGELLAVVTNGRVPACVHRVSAPSRRERLSAQFVSTPKDGFTVRPVDELVDADHPPRYNPCDFEGYIRFRYAGEGRKLSDPLEAFCGVAKGP
ncbi:unnamed protein product [Urochloa decumbens]|uniref:Fe2OG dioxygenase domain-containing protein n=1 Tax=Urochloa decumbens TaxID=240449 RepID=A0ABC9BBQ9_9POAL